MARFLPFESVKPVEQWVGQICSNNPGWYTQEELDTVFQKNLYSFLQIIRPTLEKSQASWKERFKAVRKNYKSFHEKGYYFRDKNPAYYIYQRILSPSDIFIGLIGLVHVEDFFNGVIKKHEEILEQRKELFADYLEEVRFQAEPVLLLYDENTEIHQLMTEKIRHAPLLSFTSDDEAIQHKLWRIDEQPYQARIQKKFEQIDKLYIADGHHRVDSVALYAQRKVRSDSHTDGSKPYHYVLAYLVADTQIKIYDYNRLVKDLNGLSPSEFLKKLQIFYQVTDQGEDFYFPLGKHHISLYLQGRFYDLHIKPEYCFQPEGLGTLDTYLFEQTVLRSILDIQDTCHSDRMKFIYGEGSIQSIQKIKQLVDQSEYEVGFGFYPISIEDLKRVSDLNLKLPPKSTFIRPKLLSGLTIYEMNDL
ncbi:MAG: DUF1015 domain-containing protein [Flavobacteriales bacterium AspAUS03]